ncbi:tetratricopeptide repeat protein [Planomonospora sp. ID91781]|nr:tetratricopeptide repeat protein [Planomonospora sp. ID91781]
MVAVDGAAGPGSGYVVAPHLVLTSAHVTGGAGTAVRVFRPGQDRVYGGRVAWAGTPNGRDDAALVVIDDPAWQGPAAPVRWGRTVTYRPNLGAQTWGRPQLVQRPGQATEWLQPSGTINPGDRYAGDRYVLALAAHPPAPTADGSSPWGGLSGAALFCEDLLAGVMAVDPAGRAHAHLEAVPAYVLHRDPGFRAVLAEHTGQEQAVLEPIEFQHLAEHADPATTTVAGTSSPAALLRARRQVVPFSGREHLLKDLHAWAERPGFGAHLIHAGGGHGKTRLAQQLAGQLAASGWAVLWLSARAREAGLAVVKDAAAPLLVVADYAESRTDQLAALLEACARHGGGTPVKLLLLARTAGPWWTALQASCPAAEALLDGAPVTQLTPLEPDPASRREAYRRAATAFATALTLTPGTSGQPWQELAAALPPPAAGRAGLDNALTLHMTALADLLDTAAPAPGSSPQPDTASPDRAEEAGPVEDRLLTHEKRYWTAAAVAHGLHPAPPPTRPLPGTLTDALAAALTLGASSRAEAEALLRRVPGLESADRDRIDGICAWIAAVYPPAAGAVWGALEPDRLAERWWGRRIQTDPGLADHLVAGADPKQAARLLTVYARATAHPVFDGGLGEELTGVCVRHRQALAEPAIQVATQVETPGPLLAALDRLIDDPAAGVEELQRWSNRLPHSSQALAGWAARLSECLAGHYRSSGDLPGLAGSLNNQAVRLGGLGRREEALEAITEATGLYRALADAHPDAFLPDLAGSLNNQAVQLADLGRREEALEAITEALTIRRTLADIHPDAFLPHLAGSLNNQAVHLGGLGRYEEALEAITEATGLYRALADAHPDAFLPDLAMSLNNQAVHLGGLGRYEEALEAITEALTIRRTLADIHPDAFLPDLAMSLNNQAVHLGGLGRYEEALEAITEALTIRRTLADARPAVHQTELEQSLQVLAWLQSLSDEDGAAN